MPQVPKGRPNPANVGYSHWSLTPHPGPLPIGWGEGESPAVSPAQLAAQVAQRFGDCHCGTNGATGLPLPLGGGEGRGEGAAA